MSSSSLPLRVVVLPLLVISVAQIAGCTPRPAAAPPGGTYYSQSAGALFEQTVTLRDDERTTNIASFSLQRAHRPPHSPQTIYIAAGAQGIIRSDDGGGSWVRLTTPLTFVSDVVALANGVIITAGTTGEGQGFVIRTIDDGHSWDVALAIPLPLDTRQWQIIRAPEAPDPRVISIELDPFNADRIYAGSSLGSIFVGEQSGKTWRTEYTLQASTLVGGNRQGLSIRNIIPSPHRAGELLLLTSTHTLLRVTPTTQEELLIPRDLKNPGALSFTNRKRVFDVTFVQDFPQALMVGVDDGAVISRDNGESWEQLALPLDQFQSFNTTAVAVSPTNFTRMLVAINSVVFRSEDGGKTWQTFSLNLPNHGVTALLIDPENPANILIVTTPIRT
ncbi:MAG: YCF48-related protein [Candidatus Andersenbacteria bacterium]